MLPDQTAKEEKGNVPAKFRSSPVEVPKKKISPGPKR